MHGTVDVPLGSKKELFDSDATFVGGLAVMLTDGPEHSKTRGLLTMGSSDKGPDLLF